MLNHKILFILFGLIVFPHSVFANSVPTLGSITAQRGILEDLSLQVQIQEQSQKLNQLLLPVPVQTKADELTAKQLLDKLEISEDESGEKVTTKEQSSKSSQVVAIYSNNKTMKAKVRYKGKTVLLTNGQTWNGMKVQIFRDRVLIGNKTLEL